MSLVTATVAIGSFDPLLIPLLLSSFSDGGDQNRLKILNISNHFTLLVNLLKQMEASKLMRENKVAILAQLPKDHQPIFKWFLALTELHRPSFETKEAMATVKGWFESMGATSQMDDYGNCIFSIPATKGKENVKPICVQGHLDMVAVGKFEEGGKVPIKVVDGWLTSGVSSIGADDGIAIATMLAICEDKDKFEHGPIEFLATTDEEVSLFGATKLPGPPFIKSCALLKARQSKSQLKISFQVTLDVLFMKADLMQLSGLLDFSKKHSKLQISDLFQLMVVKSTMLFQILQKLLLLQNMLKNSKKQWRKFMAMQSKKVKQSKQRHQRLFSKMLQQLNQ